MLQIFPFLAWLAAMTSAILLIVLWLSGELSSISLTAGISAFLIAAYCQFFGRSAMTGALGLLLQTMLAIYLIVRWRFLH